MYYITHLSFFLDILILLRTFKTIVVGLRHSGEQAPVAAPVVAREWDQKAATPADKVHSA